MRKLQELMEQANISQSELARRLNVTHGAVNKWVAGVARPTVDNLIALSVIFDCTMDELVADAKIDMLEDILPTR